MEGYMMSDAKFLSLGGRFVATRFFLSRGEAERLVQHPRHTEIMGLMEEFTAKHGVGPASSLARGELLRLMEDLKADVDPAMSKVVVTAIERTTMLVELAFEELRGVEGPAVPDEVATGLGAAREALVQAHDAMRPLYARVRTEEARKS